MTIEWRARTEPLEPLAVAATGDAARALVRRLLERSDDELRLLRGVVWDGGVAIEGEAGVLPWADGAQFFGRDARAARFWWPTNLEPSAPIELVARALERKLERELAPPILTWPSAQFIVSLGEARPVERDKLRAWLATSSLEG